MTREFSTATRCSDLVSVRLRAVTGIRRRQHELDKLRVERLPRERRDHVVPVRDAAARPDLALDLPAPLAPLHLRRRLAVARQQPARARRRDAVEHARLREHEGARADAEQRLQPGQLRADERLLGAGRLVGRARARDEQIVELARVVEAVLECARSAASEGKRAGLRVP